VLLVFRVVPQKDDGQHKHQDGPDDPVLDQREDQHLHIAEDPAHLLVFHLGQGRVHHQDEAHGYRDGGGAHLELGEKLVHPREEEPGAHADTHGQEDPEGEIGVKERELFL